MSLNHIYAQDGETYYFNDTKPDAVNFTLGNSPQVNDNSYYHIAYCFAEKVGFSKFGFYDGNGSTDGAFVYTGFKPAFVMTKYGNAQSNWRIFDSKRNGTNETSEGLMPNTGLLSGLNDCKIDLLSNGFKLRGGQDDTNANTGRYIYMAFAEAPLVGSNNVPATAR